MTWQEHLRENNLFTNFHLDKFIQVSNNQNHKIQISQKSMRWLQPESKICDIFNSYPPSNQHSLVIGSVEKLKTIDYRFCNFR